MKRKAELFRMVTEKHVCPYGIKSKDLLKREGYEVTDYHLRTREETDSFKNKHGVETTPQTFIDGKRIGGFDELLEYFGRKSLKQKGVTYQPIIAIFVTTFLMSISVHFAIYNQWNLIKVIEQFIAISMCVLGIMKLRDLFSFSNQFLGYDLLAQKWVPYSYIYPFAETGAGILMISGSMIWLASSVALFIGVVGGFSVFKAVYIDKRDLKCACVGGNSNVPLGFISLTENIMMILMAIWMFVKF